MRIPVGIYKVGTDLEAGSYIISASDQDTAIQIIKSNADTEAKNSYTCYSYSGKNYKRKLSSDSAEQCRFFLEDNDILEVDAPCDLSPAEPLCFAN